MIFVNSMSDLFHEEVPEEFILSVFRTMVRAKHHVFQVLTKRSRRLAELALELPWPGNVWAGVTVEARECMSRIEDLQTVPAQVRFLSLEPLLTEMPALPLSGIGWVIVGGESGPGARLIRAEWVKKIRDQCVGAGVPFFFKQWGGTNRKAAGRLLDGRTWDEFPLNNEKASRYWFNVTQEAHSRTKNWGTSLTGEAYLLPVHLSAWAMAGVVAPSRFSIPRTIR
jgi:protein gp37